MSKQRQKKAAPSAVTVARLTRGWSAPQGSRIRLAAPGEAERVDELLRLTGVPLEPAVKEAIETGDVASALLAALRHGPDSLIRPLAESAGRGGPHKAFPLLSLALVAVDREGQVVGALLALPPGRMILHAVQAGVAPFQALMPAVGLTKLKGIAVEEQRRGLGLGANLLRRCQQLFFQLKFNLVYGQFSIGSGLERFYTDCGFEVLNPRAGVPMDEMFGVPLILAAEPGEQLFVRWRGHALHQDMSERVELAPS